MEKGLSVLVVDDMADVRLLVQFLLSSAIECEVTEACSGLEAWNLFQKKKYDLVVSDHNMPDGDGIELCRKIKQKDPRLPILFVASEGYQKFEDLKSQSNMHFVAKPFTERSFIEGLQTLLGEIPSEKKAHYIPIPLPFLVMIQTIHVPLFVRLSDDKYVKVTHEESTFGTEEHQRFIKKDLEFLYIEAKNLAQFLGEYQTEVLTTDSWNEVSFDEAQKVLKLNTEVMRKCHSLLNWQPEILKTAQEGTQKALLLLSKGGSLPQLLLKFQKIEKFGFADKCTLMNLIATQISHHLNISAIDKIKLNFAVMLHDTLLMDSTYDQKKKYVEAIRRKEHTQKKEILEVFDHPTLTAEFTRGLSVCPPGTDILIQQHHEWPDGSGFPKGLSCSQIDKLAAIIIVAEDFTLHFIERLGKVDLAEYSKLRRHIFKSPPFAVTLEALTGAKPA
jgi:response regulator RpfG family c-di-GMP phosphodiesterase